MFAGAVLAFDLTQTPQYEASIKILVGQKRGITETPSDAIGLQQLTLTMAQAVSTRPVAEAVILQQDLQTTPEALLAELSVEQIPSTQFVEVSYKDPNPERARRVVNTVGEVFSEQVSAVSSSANSITATVWEPAITPDEPVSPDPARDVLLAMALGLMLGVGLAFLLEYTDDTWSSPEEAEQISGVPTLAAIPEERVAKGKKGTKLVHFSRRSELRRTQRKDESSGPGELAGRLATVLDPMSAASEAYRTLRTNLLYAFVDEPPKVIVLTSPGPKEGKSTVCANLGVVLAQAGKSCLIVDCDFRKPVMHKLFGLRNITGVVDVVAGERKLQEVWKEPMEGLKVVCVGQLPPSPTDLLSSRRFSEFLVGVRQGFDYVLVDASPVGLVSDPAVLATQGDGVLLILDAQETRKRSVRQATHDLKTVGANVLGTVINNIKASQEAYYDPGHTYGWGDSE
jgi:capsular exopolysaccharide synthesis family protein